MRNNLWHQVLKIRHATMVNISTRTYYAQGSQEAILRPQQRGRIQKSEQRGHQIGDQACAFEAQTWIEIEGI
jgi:hypothetical protein